PVVAQDPGHVALEGDGTNKLGAVVADDPATPPGKVPAKDFASAWAPVAGQSTGIVDPRGPDNMGFGSALAHVLATELGPVVAQDPGQVELQGDDTKKLGAVVAQASASEWGALARPYTGIV